MRKIHMVDLLSQYDKIREEVDSAVLSVVSSGAYINGPEVKDFGNELAAYLDAKHVIPCANGTDALQIALMAIGCEPGDEIITPSFTYVATAEVIALLNLKPVFVEVDPNYFTLDIDAVKQAITPKTKAIIPVHLYGLCAPMEELLALAQENDIHVVEDTAQAIGSNYTFSDGRTAKAGTMGHIGCTSFFPSKNLGCFGDGGAIFTNDDELGKTIKMVANHGQSKRYYHDLIGVNSRLDSIQAAILRIKLRHLDLYLQNRNEAAAYYNQAFASTDKITTPVTAPYSDHGFHQYTMKLHNVDRDGLVEHLSAKGIPSNIYYPVPIHLQKGYTDYGFDHGNLQLTEDLCAQVFSLPIHTELDEEQLAFISSSVLEFIN